LPVVVDKLTRHSMYDQELIILLGSAASLGLLHTLLGPDHYVPFVMMGKAGGWSLRKTCLVTAFCGIGHVAGSVLLGFAGIAIGIALHKLEWVEAFRGSLAAWLFIGFGLVYLIWGLKKALRNRPHTHMHSHPGTESHIHKHTHDIDHLHVHDTSPPGLEAGRGATVVAQHQKKNMSIWILFVIFILGPCEPLIPLLMYPAARQSLAGIVAVSCVFLFFTVATMTILVALAYTGARAFRWGLAERYMHALAGFTLLLCGVGIAFLGL
jgi:nickel/cobalt transporter (NicO) family protein